MVDDVKELPGTVGRVSGNQDAHSLSGAAAWLTFDADTHPADAIQRAVYRFSDVLTVELTRTGQSYLCSVFFRSGSDSSLEAREDTLHRLRSEVVDQVLRARIRAETEAVRNLILAVAFSGTSLLDVVE
jgi:His-Xaa-Ser system protein HxsD